MDFRYAAAGFSTRTAGQLRTASPLLLITPWVQSVSQSVSQLLVHITQQKEAFSFSSERISSDVCCRNESLSRFQRTVLKSSPSQTLVLTFLCMHANSTLLEFCTFPVQLLKMKYSWCAQLTDVISGRKKPDFLQSNDTAHLVGSEVKWPQQ